MKWMIHKFMNDCNPVCTDAGDLTIRKNPDGSPYFVADGIAFAPSDNWQVLQRGYTWFTPFRDVVGKDVFCDHLTKKFADMVDKHGQPVPLYGGMYPVTTDPRVLMVMHHYFHKGWRILGQVPTRDEAVRYLLKEKALYPLIPPEFPYENNRPLTEQAMEDQGLTVEMI